MHIESTSRVRPRTFELVAWLLALLAVAILAYVDLIPTMAVVVFLVMFWFGYWWCGRGEQKGKRGSKPGGFTE
jgi:Flp pilus assembly protein TadB